MSKERYEQKGSLSRDSTEGLTEQEAFKKYEIDYAELTKRLMLFETYVPVHERKKEEQSKALVALIETRGFKK